MTMSSWWRQIQNHPRLRTVVIAGAAFVSSGPASRLTPPVAVHGGGWWPAVLLAAVACTALLWHERRPRTTAAVAVVCTVALTALGYLLTALSLAPLMAALYWLAAHTDRRTTLAFVLSACALVVGTALIVDPPSYPWPLKTIGPAAWILMPASLGGARRIKQDYLDAVRSRAEYAERTREAEASRRVADERTRIARELHDVVAHHLTLAHAQAGTAAHLVQTRPDQAQQILTSLTATTSSALRDLKATVGLLRQGDDPAAPLEPTPSLTRLPELARTFASAGLTVTINTRGERPPLSPSVDLTAYRIAQEALTNVAKHTTTSSAQVDITYSPSSLTMMIINGDDGADRGRRSGATGEATAGGGTADGADQPAAATSTSPANSGFGLISMRERALSVGGHLEAGSHPEVGFHVTAVLPLHPGNPTTDRTR
ncbi:two-component sensor histidine kinase [Parafrankia colletiae]|uniref:histidine kinase n=1 Tax=Parafrankia colletiae TaxID=573497 RepID=A0A1S1Q0L0_9ACTN|nr:sensor histidine kinase [Parafrankia colletiae]MCK9904717.1 sensor histidine kinase [Frankia sp. Cpl3]OHV27116.1 two-component sensor histidine kinase [Parafrankia colletiae]